MRILQYKTKVQKKKHIKWINYIITLAGTFSLPFSQKNELNEK